MGSLGIQRWRSELMDWLVLSSGILLLSIATVSVVTKGVAPTRRVSPQRRLRLVPAMLLAGVGLLLESVPRLLTFPVAVVSVAGVVGALMLIASAIVAVRQGKVMTKERG
jgi:hypothetical protein